MRPSFLGRLYLVPACVCHFQKFLRALELYSRLAVVEKEAAICCCWAGALAALMLACHSVEGDDEIAEHEHLGGMVRECLRKPTEQLTFKKLSQRSGGLCCKLCLQRKSAEDSGGRINLCGAVFLLGSGTELEHQY